MLRSRLLLGFCGSGIGRVRSSVRGISSGVSGGVRDISSGGGGGIGSVLSRVGHVRLGGIAGSTVGGGRRANTAGAVAGAAAGGAAGNAIAGSTTAGVEVTVLLESGQTIAVVQAGSPNEFRVGDSVRVSSDGVTTRVSR